jgi:alkylation response protein AidB-like acyl-CoA dehydrogenase
MENVELGSMDPFRQELRAFIDAHLPKDIAARAMQCFHASKADQEIWGRILYSRGWSAPAWPKRFGGQEWSAKQIQVFDEECYRAGAPEVSWNGIRLVGPVI